MTPELQSQVQQLRIKAAAGEELTKDDMRLLINALREGRVSAHHASDTARKKAAKAAIPSAADINALLEAE